MELVGEEMEIAGWGWWLRSDFTDQGLSREPAEEGVREQCGAP